MARRVTSPPLDLRPLPMDVLLTAGDLPQAGGGGDKPGAGAGGKEAGTSAGTASALLKAPSSTSTHPPFYTRPPAVTLPIPAPLPSAIEIPRGAPPRPAPPSLDGSAWDCGKAFQEGRTFRVQTMRSLYSSSGGVGGRPVPHLVTARHISRSAPPPPPLFPQSVSRPLFK